MKGKMNLKEVSDEEFAKEYTRRCEIKRLEKDINYRKGWIEQEKESVQKLELELELEKRK